MNTSGFLMAVLLNEGLIKLINGKTRSYTCCDPTAFTASIQALIDSKVSLGRSTTSDATAEDRQEEQEGRQMIISITCALGHRQFAVHVVPVN